MVGYRETAMTAVLGITLSVLLADYVAHWERMALRNEVHELALERTVLLRSTIDRSMQILYALRAFYQAGIGFDEATFLALTRDAVQRIPELQALEWVPRVPHARRPTLENAMRERGHPHFQFTELNRDGHVQTAAERAEYYPVCFVEPLTGNQPALGLDLQSDVRRGEAIRRAAVSGLPAATAPIRLAQEPGNQQGFIMFLPVYKPDVAATERHLAGFMLAVFRSGELISSVWGDFAERHVAVTVFDDNVPDEPAFFRQGGAATPKVWYHQGLWNAADLSQSIPMEVAGRHWRLYFTPNASFMAQHLPWQTGAAFLSGLLISTLLCAYQLVQTRRRVEIARANQALQAASRAKTDFLASMSHEIRTPMNAVLGYAQLLQRDERLSQDQQETVTGILVGGRQLLGEINDVLDLAKIETGRMELHDGEIDLCTLLREMELMFRPRCSEKHLHFRAAHDGEPLVVHGDGGKLRQILINLIGNALRFTDRGEIALDITHQAGEIVRFEVVDTGPGIEPADRERIFEPFYQSRNNRVADGTGLGLAIAKRHAEYMGGGLEVFSEPGCGSRFRLQLPLPPSANPAECGNLEPGHWRLKPPAALYALVVDDRAANRDILRRLLRAADCITAEAAEVEAAKSMIRSRPPDIVFMDLGLNGADGRQLARELKHLQPPLRLIAYSALAFEHDRKRALESGFDGFVAKPVRTDSLFEELQRVSGCEFIRTPLPAANDRAQSSPDLARLRLPAALLERLRSAAAAGRVTKLKTALAELRTLGEQERQLAADLKAHLQRFDLGAIEDVLKQVLTKDDNR